MARRYRISRPMVIDTDLGALTEMFRIEPSDDKEQWYYANDGSYQPDRSLSPLILSPSISVWDADTGQSYTPSFSSVAWYVKEWSGSAYVETLVTATEDSSEADYVNLADSTLLVKKNVSPDHAVTIRCAAEYIDPRDIAVTHHIEAEITLLTNRDATVIYPTINISSPSSVRYRPLKDVSSQKTFVANVMLKGEDVTSSNVIEWRAVESSVEYLIENLPCYVSGQGTATLVVDAMYADDLTIIARAKPDAQSQLYPTRSVTTLSWEMPVLDVNAYSPNGSAVRMTTESMEFGVIVNADGEMMTEEEKGEHLAVNWFIRPQDSSLAADVKDKGWGQRMTAAGAELYNHGSSTIVWTEVYLLSPYCEVTQGGDDLQITIDGVTYDIVERTKE